MLCIISLFNFVSIRIGLYNVLTILWNESNMFSLLSPIVEADDRERALEYNRGWRNQHGGRYADDMTIDGLMAGDADAM